MDIETHKTISEILPPGTKESLSSGLESSLLSEETFRSCFFDNAYRLFVDMDGVLTDWMKQYKSFGGTPFESSEDLDWSVTQNFNFWATMEWIPGGRELWDSVKDLTPVILTSPGESRYAREGKLVWCKENLGETINVVVDSQKYKYADRRSILIDDMDKNTIPWEEHKGIAILYDNGNYLKACRDLYKAVLP